MSTATTSQPGLASSSVPATRAVRAGAAAGIGALALNLTVLGIGSSAGAQMLVTQPGAQTPISVGVGMVVAVTLTSLVLGTVALALAGRWGARGWRAMAWLGLAIGIVSVIMPASVTATVGTRLTLASMHVIVGLAWFVAVRRGLAQLARAAA